MVGIFFKSHIRDTPSLAEEHHSFEVMFRSVSEVLALIIGGLNDYNLFPSDNWRSLALRRIHVLIHCCPYFILNLEAALLLSCIKERLREPVRESDVEGEAVLANEGHLVVKLVDAVPDVEESILASTYFL